MRQTSASRDLRLILIAALACALAVALGTALFLGRDQAAFGGMASGVVSEVAADSALSAAFALSNGRIVHLDYLDGENFRLADDGAAVETLVVDGQIYLHFLESPFQKEQLWRYGELAPERALNGRHRKIALRPTSIPSQGVALWGDVGPVFDVGVNASGPLGIPSEATVAKAPGLAYAQWKIATRLLPAMNMAACGDGVQQLTSWWDPTLAGSGWAILATSAGVRLDGSITQLAQFPVLPIGVEVRSLAVADEW